MKKAETSIILPHVAPQRLMLTNADGDCFLAFHEIVSIEAADNQVVFHTLLPEPKMQTIVVSKTLKEIEQAIDHHLFMRVHRSWIVNLLHIRQRVRVDGLWHLVMMNGAEVPLSDAHAQQVIDALAEIALPIA